MSDNLVPFLTARFDEEAFTIEQTPQTLSAKRALLEDAVQHIADDHASHADFADWTGGLNHNSEPPKRDTDTRDTPGLTRALRHLATAYATHPDYEAEWAL